MYIFLLLLLVVLVMNIFLLTEKTFIKAMAYLLSAAPASEEHATKETKREC